MLHGDQNATHLLERHGQGPTVQKFVPVAQPVSASLCADVDPGAKRVRCAVVLGVRDQQSLRPVSLVIAEWADTRFGHGRLLCYLTLMTSIYGAASDLQRATDSSSRRSDLKSRKGTRQTWRWVGDRRN